MAIDVYSLPAVQRAQAALTRYRGKVESGIGQAQTIAMVGGASYLAARLSAHLGGPEGKTILGVPLELALGAACGALAMGGQAGKHTEDVLAVGVGAIAAYTARLGFTAGLQTARPPMASAEATTGAIGGVDPAYQLAAPLRQAAVPPPVMPAYRPIEQYEVAAEPDDVGAADPYADASQVLDGYGRR